MQRFSQWQWQKWWGVLVLVGSLLRAWGIERAPLWYDESITLWMSQSPLANMVTATAGDVHPPLWYAITWLVAHLGASGWMIRLPALALSIVGLVLLRYVAEALEMGPAVILGGTALMALLPFELYYAQEARMYALLQALTLWALLSALRRRWWQLGVSLALMLWTHNYGVYYCAVIWVLAFAREMKHSAHPRVHPPDFVEPLPAPSNFPALWRAGFIAGLAYLPWVGVLAGQAAEQKGLWWVTASTPGRLLDALYMLWWQLTLTGTLASIGALLAYTLTFGALARAILDRKNLTLVYLIVTPWIMVMVTELVYRPVLLYRALIGTAGPLWLLVAWAITEGLPRWRTAAAWVAIGPMLAIGALMFQPLTAQAKGGTDQTNLWTVIRPKFQSGDMLYHADIGSMVDAYSLRAVAPNQALMPVVPGSLGVPNHQVRAALGMDERPLADLSWHRAWVIWSAGPMINTAEDRAVLDMVAKFPNHQLIYQYHDGVGDAMVWLVQR